MMEYIFDITARVKLRTRSLSAAEDKLKRLFTKFETRTTTLVSMQRGIGSVVRNRSIRT